MRNYAKNFELLLLLGALTAFAPLSIDMYLPALPMLELEFDTPTEMVQLSLTSFFIAFALGQVIYGPLADRFGRKKPLYAGLLIFTIASVGCAIAPTVGFLIAMRFFQGLGACAGAVLARAMVRDLFPPAEMRRVYSMLILVMGIAPILAPIFGSYILAWKGWMMIFATLTAIGGICLVMAFFRLPETHASNKRRRIDIGSIFSFYGQLLSDWSFLRHALAGSISMAGMFAYITGSPHMFITLHHLSTKDYSWLFGLNALGLIGLSQVNGRLLGGIPAEKVMRSAIVAQTVAGILLLLAGISGAGGIIGIVLPLFVYIACVGLIAPNATTLAMTSHGKDAGMASAMIGLLQFSLAALATVAVSTMEEIRGDALPMTLAIATCAVIGFLLPGGRLAKPR